MTPLPHVERLAVSGFTCGVMVMVAGVVALLSDVGVVVASALITLAAMVVALGFGAARDRARRFDIGLLVPIVAALPLFGIFYAIGRLIFARFGQGIGGGLLLAIGVVLAVASTVLALRDRKHARS
jgi:MFS family permease